VDGQNLNLQLRSLAEVAAVEVVVVEVVAVVEVGDAVWAVASAAASVEATEEVVVVVSAEVEVVVSEEEIAAVLVVEIAAVLAAAVVVVSAVGEMTSEGEVVEAASAVDKGDAAEALDFKAVVGSVTMALAAALEDHIRTDHRTVEDLDSEDHPPEMDSVEAGQVGMDRRVEDSEEGEEAIAET